MSETPQVYDINDVARAIYDAEQRSSEPAEVAEYRWAAMHPREKKEYVHRALGAERVIAAFYAPLLAQERKQREAAIAVSNASQDEGLAHYRRAEAAEANYRREQKVRALAEGEAKANLAEMHRLQQVIEKQGAQLRAAREAVGLGNLTLIAHHSTEMRAIQIGLMCPVCDTPQGRARMATHARLEMEAGV